MYIWYKTNEDQQGPGFDHLYIDSAQLNDPEDGLIQLGCNLKEDLDEQHQLYLFGSVAHVDEN